MWGLEAQQLLILLALGLCLGHSLPDHKNEAGKIEVN
jgi:hypothetical protein